MDFVWRTRVARLVARQKPERVLDLATGSGDLVIALLKACPQAHVTGADFCPAMLEEARRKGVPHLVHADALALPFAEGLFDVVTVAFGLRNMASWPGAVKEMARVLREGGLLVVLDFSLPDQPLARWIYRQYLHRILPPVAGWTTGRPEAYAYLAESIEAFPRGDSMNALIGAEGLACNPPRPMCLGVVTLYSAFKDSKRAK